MTSDTKTERLAKEIKEIIVNRGISCEVQVLNNGKCIRVEGRDIFIWIRTMDLGNSGFYVDINNIVLDPSLQRKGLCKDLVKMIRSRRYVDNACISSVCTDNMLAFCRKHKMIYNGSRDAFMFKSREPKR